MHSITVKTPFPKQAMPLLKEAIETETKLTRDSLALTNERITKLADTSGVGIEELLEGSVSRTEENEMALLELEGELEIRRSLEEALSNLESMELCG